jgi:hypothetical protein
LALLSAIGNASLLATCSPIRNYTDTDGLPGFLIDVIDHKHDGGHDVTAVK